MARSLKMPIGRIRVITKVLTSYYQKSYRRFSKRIGASNVGNMDTHILDFPPKKTTKRKLPTLQ